MFIVCPKCFTKYLVSDKIQSKNLQKCHCSACGHYFDQTLGDVQDDGEKQTNTSVLTVDSVISDDVKQVQEQKEALDALNESLPTAIFSEPLVLNEKEKKSEDSLLSVVPEEFKPVENKKTSFLSMLLWLSIGAGICFAAYHQKDYLIDSIDTFVLSQLDKTKAQKQVLEKSVKQVSSAVPVVVQKDEFLPMQQEQVKLTPAEKLPVDIVVPEQEKVVETVDTIKNCLTSLQVQNIGYELGVNEVGMNRLLIRGMVVNTSLKTCPIPETKAVIYDEEDNIVARKRVLFNEKSIVGNSELLFETTVVPSPKSVSKIEVVFDE